jgi:hypothetical protein
MSSGYDERVETEEMVVPPLPPVALREIGNVPPKGGVVPKVPAIGLTVNTNVAIVA